MSFIVWTSVFPVLSLTLLALWLEGPHAVLQQLQHSWLARGGAVAYLAVLSTLLGYGQWTRCCSAMPPAYGAAVAAGAGDCLVSAMVLLGERPLHRAMAGTLAVLLGMVSQLGVWARRRF